jgi:hypothetical protein
VPDTLQKNVSGRLTYEDGTPAVLMPGMVISIMAIEHGMTLMSIGTSEEASDQAGSNRILINGDKYFNIDGINPYDFINTVSVLIGLDIVMKQVRDDAWTCLIVER